MVSSFYSQSIMCALVDMYSVTSRYMVGFYYTRCVAQIPPKMPLGRGRIRASMPGKYTNTRHMNMLAGENLQSTALWFRFVCVLQMRRYLVRALEV